mmetsp:Transcript_3496/g.5851  ORF Transcript_3496/g.5851 Transcript_3496/m.5851 type:complete len:344 (+) Transcript_3496:2-1033(+)
MAPPAPRKLQKMANQHIRTSSTGGILRWLSLTVVLVAVLPKLLELVFRREFKVLQSNGIVVISGTSTGIGRQACGQLAERHSGITFYCGVRRLQDGAGYPFTRENVEPVILDVTKDEDVQAVMNQVQSSDKPLIGIINNAGIFEYGTVEFQELDSYRWHFEVHVFGSYRLTQAALPLLRDNKGGRVIQIGSVVGALPALAATSAYTGAKYAQEAFVDAMRNEVEDLQISVSIVQPGLIKTELTKKAVQLFTKVLDSVKAGTGGAEIQAYPHLFREESIQAQIDQIKGSGDATETIDAIDDALFGKFPKTRYITGGLGPIPSWFASRLFNSVPDRLADILKKLV